MDETTARFEAARIIKAALAVDDTIVHVEEYEGDGDTFIEALTRDIESAPGYGINIPADIGSENASSQKSPSGLNEILGLVIQICYNPQKKSLAEIASMSKAIKSAFVVENDEDYEHPWVWNSGAVTTIDFEDAITVRQIFIGARIFTN